MDDAGGDVEAEEVQEEVAEGMDDLVAQSSGPCVQATGGGTAVQRGEAGLP
jgi:hypothetical protein